MEQLLDYVAALVLAFPLMALLAVPVVFVLCAAVMAASDWLLWALEVRDRIAAARQRRGSKDTAALPAGGFARMSALARHLNR